MDSIMRLRRKYHFDTDWYIVRIDSREGETIDIRDGKLWYRRTGFPVKEMRFMTPDDHNLASFHSSIGYRPESEDAVDCLKQRIGDLEQELDRARLVQSELERMVDERDDLVGEIRRDHDAEMEDMERTMSHMQAEMRRRDSVDVKGIVGSMLEYVAAMDNMVRDHRGDLPFSELAEARRQKLMMLLEGQGLTVHAPTRGNILGDGRMDVRTVETDDPVLDGVIARVDGYGFSFRDDVYPGEAPSVTVYRNG